MTDIGIEPEQLRRLLRLAEDAGLSELRLEKGELSLVLKTGSAVPSGAGVPFPGFLPGAAIGTPFTALTETVAVDSLVIEEETEFETSDIAPESDATLLRVEAPLMGIFYRSATPDEPAFVEVGDTVEVGQVIGLIEAMKVFSEVPSEVAGRVRAIPVTNATLVQPGDTLVLLEPME
ncbi:MAG: acetyl-CoA carboxylase biotin carboxyl carrier protein [Armatimonadaceae bacterium]